MKHSISFHLLAVIDSDPQTPEPVCRHKHAGVYDGDSVPVIHSPPSTI